MKERVNPTQRRVTDLEILLNKSRTPKQHRESNRVIYRAKSGSLESTYRALSEGHFDLRSMSVILSPSSHLSGVHMISVLKPEPSNFESDLMYVGSAKSIPSIRSLFTTKDLLEDGSAVSLKGPDLDGDFCDWILSKGPLQAKSRVKTKYVLCWKCEEYSINKVTIHY